MIMPLMPLFGNASFLVMIYPYALFFRKTAGPNGYISGFPKNVCILAVAAMTVGRRPDGFQPNSYNKFVGVNCPFLKKKRALISIILSSTKKI